MRNVERLLEAVEYSIENNEHWWECFDSIEEAREVIRLAMKEEPDDSDVVMLVDLIGDTDYFDKRTAVQEYKRCLTRLKKSIKRFSDED
jgi:hypothetical protein